MYVACVVRLSCGSVGQVVMVYKTLIFKDIPSSHYHTITCYKCNHLNEPRLIFQKVMKLWGASLSSYMATQDV